MEALGSAFDIIIVGALALPWVLVAIHLFLSENESRFDKLLAWVKKQDQRGLRWHGRFLVLLVLVALQVSLRMAMVGAAGLSCPRDGCHVQPP